jgi:NADPH-dependent 2,4-dienoyl-CoA reductase/sulfur reductase-like enzyme
MEDLQVITAARFRDERGIDVRLGHTVLAIDRAGRTVVGRNAEGDFRLAYDKLILCTGARVSMPCGAKGPIRSRPSRMAGCSRPRWGGGMRG